MDDIDFSKAKPRGPFTGGLAAKKGDLVERAELKRLVDQKILNFLLREDSESKFGFVLKADALKAIVSLSVAGKIDADHVGADNVARLTEEVHRLGLADERGIVADKGAKSAIDTFLKSGGARINLSDALEWKDPVKRKKEFLLSRSLSIGVRSAYYAARGDVGAHR